MPPQQLQPLQQAEPQPQQPEQVRSSNEPILVTNDDSPWITPRKRKSGSSIKPASNSDLNKQIANNELLKNKQLASNELLKNKQIANNGLLINMECAGSKQVV